MNPTDVAWLAGLFEGEGCFEIQRNGGTRLTIRMTDKDVIDKVDALFPCLRIQVVIPKPVRDSYKQPKTQYAWRISDPIKVREFIMLIRPWLGGRRGAKADDLLNHLDTRPGTGSHHREKTHCAEGHEYTPENTYIRPGTTHRHCRTCRDRWARESMARKASRLAAASVSASGGTPVA